MKYVQVNAEMFEQVKRMLAERTDYYHVAGNYAVSNAYDSALAMLEYMARENGECLDMMDTYSPQKD